MSGEQVQAIEMYVVGLLLDPNTQAPIVVLKDESGKYCLPIWIGVAEATSIASALKNLTLPRPMTHDLISTILTHVHLSVERVVITELKEATYFAELLLSQGERAILLDARPSDAIAIALRATAPIFVTQHVLDQAKVEFPANFPFEQLTAPGEAVQVSEEWNAQGEETDFKQIDKDKWSDILSTLDPDDFKYKM